MRGRVRAYLQIRHLCQSKLSLAGTRDRSADELDFMQYGTLKIILMEQVPNESARVSKDDLA